MQTKQGWNQKRINFFGPNKKVVSIFYERPKSDLEKFGDRPFIKWSGGWTGQGSKGRGLGSSPALWRLVVPSAPGAGRNRRVHYPFIFGHGRLRSRSSAFPGPADGPVASPARALTGGPPTLSFSGKVGCDTFPFRASRVDSMNVTIHARSRVYLSRGHCTHSFWRAAGRPIEDVLGGRKAINLHRCLKGCVQHQLRQRHFSPKSHQIWRNV